ncbi:MAG: hypothetical protein ACK5R0_09410, partial [Bacteroidota bacterium]
MRVLLEAISKSVFTVSLSVAKALYRLGFVKLNLTNATSFRWLFLFFVLVLGSCSKPVELKTGTWRGVIDCQGHDLPFIFEVAKNGELLNVHIKN